MEKSVSAADARRPAAAGPKQDATRPEQVRDREPEEADQFASVEYQATENDEEDPEIARSVRPEMTMRAREGQSGHSRDDEYTAEGEIRRTPSMRGKIDPERDDDNVRVRRYGKPTLEPEKQHQLSAEEHQDEESAIYDVSRRRESRPKVGKRNGVSSGDRYEGTENRGPSDVTRNGRSSRVFEEYMDLVEDTEALDAPGYDLDDPRAIDVNLLSSLTRWTSVAKLRVGEEKLQEMLDLYARSGHLSMNLRELLQQISAMVDEAPLEATEDAHGCVDLIFHLHGILAGGLAIHQTKSATRTN